MLVLLTFPAHKRFNMQAGVGLSVNTERELVNHRKLLHPNIIRLAASPAFV